MDTNFYRVRVCEHTKQPILQFKCSDGEWLCCHCETREQELAEIMAYAQAIGG